MTEAQRLKDFFLELLKNSNDSPLAINMKSEPPTLFKRLSDIDTNLDPFSQDIEWVDRDDLTGKVLLKNAKLY